MRDLIDLAHVTNWFYATFKIIQDLNEFCLSLSLASSFVSLSLSVLLSSCSVVQVSDWFAWAAWKPNRWRCNLINESGPFVVLALLWSAIAAHQLQQNHPKREPITAELWSHACAVRSAGLNDVCVRPLDNNVLLLLFLQTFQTIWTQQIFFFTELRTTSLVLNLGSAGT